MDVVYALNGITFVWNATKATANKHRHAGISFEQAAQSFFDPFIKLVDASRNDESREAIIGMDKAWNLLFVVHIQIEDDRIRLISARKATRKEQEYYEN
ncbi:hypothetical protein SAMN02745130_02736 [Thiothrix eikelboomii]|uniref:Uncharacterized protein n=1 Tax=Thiothrix eikelboomii TaxID=92487 RepID=A0A1T4XCC4_9GAMM|nr:BrnT family toxin [Thiothrix eikelboomii]SKA86611.1 hypothetical protein SAMN02745130_02736 [Thiothrix eikelboomii]